ncbi:hypothetical protein D9M68_896790 [compost metagenome]
MTDRYSWTREIGEDRAAAGAALIPVELREMIDGLDTGAIKPFYAAVANLANSAADQCEEYDGYCIGLIDAAYQRGELGVVERDELRNFIISLCADVRTGKRPA